jgi:hypothetical protein
MVCTVVKARFLDLSAPLYDSEARFLDLSAPCSVLSST